MTRKEAESRQAERKEVEALMGLVVLEDAEYALGRCNKPFDGNGNITEEGKRAIWADYRDCLAEKLADDMVCAYAHLLTPRKERRD